MNVKQVIVMRSDLRNQNGLKVRTGKLIAQGAHASIAWLVDKIEICEDEDGWAGHSARVGNFTPAQRAWLEGSFTKVTLKVNSEEELLAIRDAARAAKLTVSLITDAGRTEFGGVPTNTCLAIGPDLAEDIDKVTGDLELL